MKTKKLFTILFSILILIVAGCDKEENPTGPENDIVGTWVLTKVILPDYGNMEVNPQPLGLQMTLKVNSDKTFEMTVVDSDSTETDTGTWSISNGKITIKSNTGETLVFDYELTGNQLKITMQFDVSEFGLSGMGQTRVIMVFTKQ